LCCWCGDRCWPAIERTPSGAAARHRAKRGGASNPPVDSGSRLPRLALAGRRRQKPGVRGWPYRLPPAARRTGVHGECTRAPPWLHHGPSSLSPHCRAASTLTLRHGLGPAQFSFLTVVTQAMDLLAESDEVRPPGARAGGLSCCAGHERTMPVLPAVEEALCPFAPQLLCCCCAACQAQELRRSADGRSRLPTTVADAHHLCVVHLPGRQNAKAKRTGGTRTTSLGAGPKGSHSPCSR
jgi:hypothetical protein